MLLVSKLNRLQRGEYEAAGSREKNVMWICGRALGGSFRAGCLEIGMPGLFLRSLGHCVTIGRVSL